MQIALICILILLPLFYELSTTFKYMSKMFLFNLILMITSVVGLPVTLVRPFNLENYWFPYWVFRMLTKIYGIKIEARNLENYDIGGPFILVCNHQSSLDLIVMATCWPNKCTAMVKKELLYTGPFGLILKLANAIFVERQNTDKARQTLARVFQHIKAEGIRVWVFPEGTRNHESGMLPFKKGAFHLAVDAQIPVLPLVISSYSDFYNKKERKFGSGKLIVEALSAIPTVGLTKDDVPGFAERVRKLMLDVYNKNSTKKHSEVESNGAT